MLIFIIFCFLLGALCGVIYLFRKEIYNLYLKIKIFKYKKSILNNKYRLLLLVYLLNLWIIYYFK